MKLRWMMLLLFAAVALLAIPVVGTADDESKDEAKKEKCCDKAAGDDAKCCKKDGQAVAVKFDGVMCPISGHDIDENSTVDHNGGKVYLCCDDCLEAWQKDMADDGEKKLLTKANYQLVATGQAEQTGCPVSGKKVKDGSLVKVGQSEIEVGFCCKNCTKKANSAEGDDLLAMVFGEKAFAKAFTVSTEEEKETK